MLGRCYFMPLYEVEESLYDDSTDKTYTRFQKVENVIVIKTPFGAKELLSGKTIPVKKVENLSEKMIQNYFVDSDHGDLGEGIFVNACDFTKRSLVEYSFNSTCYHTPYEVLALNNMDQKQKEKLIKK